MLSYFSKIAVLGEGFSKLSIAKQVYRFGYLAEIRKQNSLIDAYLKEEKIALGTGELSLQTSTAPLLLFTPKWLLSCIKKTHLVKLVSEVSVFNWEHVATV